MASVELATGAGFLFAHDPYRKIAAHFSGIIRLHTVTLEHPAACLAEPRPVRLQAVLDRTVIAEILPAKALGVTRTGLPFLRGSLRHCDRNAREGNCNSQSQSDHRNLILTMLGGGLNRPRSVAVRTRAGADSSVIRQPIRASWFCWSALPTSPWPTGSAGDVKLTRTQTIMQGTDHCDFRYRRMKDQGSETT